MQWDGAPHAGFSTAEPWLPLSPDAATRNVEALRDDPASMLTLLSAAPRPAPRARGALSVGGYRGVAGRAPGTCSPTSASRRRRVPASCPEFRRRCAQLCPARGDELDGAALDPGPVAAGERAAATLRSGRTRG